MKEIWYFVFLAVAVMALLLIPFSMFYYETNEDDAVSKRLCSAI